MFISKEERDRRLNSSENVLKQVKKDHDIRSGVPHTQEPIIPEVLPPSGKALEKLLGVKSGKNSGPKMSREVQAAISTCAALISGNAAAELFNTSRHHAQELKKGFTHEEAQYGYESGKPQEPREDILRIVDSQKGVVRDLAFEKLTATLGLISEDKLAVITDATKLARVAKDLSQVHDKAMPREEKTQGDVLHFHVWRPEMREETTYETVTVGRED